MLTLYSLSISRNSHYHNTRPNQLAGTVTLRDEFDNRTEIPLSPATVLKIIEVCKKPAAEAVVANAKTAAGAFDDAIADAALEDQSKVLELGRI